MALDLTFYIDPSCPFGYSATPDLTALRWRYGTELRWRAVLIGLSEPDEPSKMPGLTPTTVAQLAARFGRDYGMPVGAAPRERRPTSGRACRALVAVRLRQPDRFWDALRALQFGWFCGTASLDEDPALHAALATVPGLDADAAIAAIADPETEAAYQQDRSASRSAAGSPAAAQGKASGSGDQVRYTAPSLQFATADGRQLEAGGFQSLAVYDALVANLDPTLARNPVPEDPYEALIAFGHGLTTQEVAAILAPPLTTPDRADAEARLLELAGAGRAERVGLGNDALWRAR